MQKCLVSMLGLMFGMLGKNFSSFLFAISCKLSAKETVCMKFRILFSGGGGGGGGGGGRKMSSVFHMLNLPNEN